MSNKAKTLLLPNLRFPEFRDWLMPWESRELGPITLKVGSGITPTGGDKNYRATGRPFVRSQNVGWGELILDDVAYIDEEMHQSFGSTEIATTDVLLNITGASIGRSAVADARVAAGNVNQHVCIIRVKPTELNPFFLNQYLISEYGQRQIDSFQAGGNRQGLNFSQIRSFLIPLPQALPEQQKIADCLSFLDELIAAQARKVDTLKTHKRGLMQQLFPREGETQPHLRFPEFRNAGGWKEVTLGQLMTIKGRIGYRGYTVEDIVEVGEGAISLSPSNISTAGTLSFEKSTYISWAKFYESPEIILEKNFTVLVKTGSTYGKVAFIRDLPHECTVNPQIVVLKPTSVNPYFLYLLIGGELIQSRIESTVVGGAIPTLSQENISKFVVCVPSDAEQKRIADCLTSLDDLITTAIQDIETLKTHKKGLMQQLFPSSEHQS